MPRVAYVCTGLRAADRVPSPNLHCHDVAPLEESVNRTCWPEMGVARAFRMAFVSAGGYHHHVGLNTWQGEGAPPPPADALGLRHFQVLLPNVTELEHVIARVRGSVASMEQLEHGLLVRDPSQNGVLLTAAS